MKKTLSLVLALLMLLTMVPTMAMADEPIVITWLMQGDNNVAEDNEMIQYLNQKLGIDLRITYVSKTDYDTKLNTLIAGDQLPDIFKTEGLIAEELKDAGKLLDIAPYLPEYGKDILASYEEGELAELGINDADSVYALNSKAGLYVGNFHFRKDWLAKVGKEVPTTLDELYDVLKAFTIDDPDGNGANDTYGYTAQMDTAKTWEHIFAAYGIPYEQNITLEDGTVTRYVKHPNYLRAIEFLRKLYQDGIMDPDFAAMTWVEYAEKLWNGEIGIFGFQSVGPCNNWFPGRYTFDYPEKVEDLFVFAHIAHADTGLPTGGVKPYAKTPSYGAVVSSACKHPEKVVELLNYMYYTEEGQTTTYMGVEGTMFNWTDKDNGKYERVGVYADDTIHRAAGAYVYNTSGGWTIQNAETRTMNTYTQTSQAEEMAIATDYTFIGATLETWSDYGTALKDVEHQMLANLIVTTGDVQAEYEAFIEQWNEEGGLEFEEEATEYMQNK